MRVQKINQSSIYRLKSRQDGSAPVLQNCCPKPKPISQIVSNGMLSFKGRVKTEYIKPLMNKVGVFIENTYSLIADSFNKSNTKKNLVAPIQKKWSDFTYNMPRTARALKSTAIVTTFVTALDSGK